MTDIGQVFDLRAGNLDRYRSSFCLRLVAVAGMNSRQFHFDFVAFYLHNADILLDEVLYLAGANFSIDGVSALIERFTVKVEGLVFDGYIFDWYVVVVGYAYPADWAVDYP